MNIEDLQTGDIILINDTESGIFNWFKYDKIYNT